MKKLSVTIPALSNDADGVSVSQTPLAAGNLTITGALATGGVATIAAAQPITITAVSDESGRTFTVTGTDADGTVISEDVTGPNATTAVTTKFFKTVTQISVDAATAGAVTVGPLSASGAVSATLDVPVNEFGDDFKALIVTKVTGTNTSSVESSEDDIDDTFDESVQVDGNWVEVATHADKTASTAALAVLPAESHRLKISSYTSGTAKLTIVVREPLEVRV